MSAPAPASPGLAARFVLAWVAFFRTLADATFAAGVARLRAGQPALPPPADDAPAKRKAKKASTKDEDVSAPPSDAPRPSPLREISPDAALQLLALLQREGRFVDFLEEDVASFDDAQIGAAARVVHEGCRKALREHVPLEPVRTEEEGSRVKIAKGFDAAAIRLTGNVSGEPPYTGTLAHRGWRAREVTLPKLAEGHDARVVAPAEIEL